jgi:hypothetical protein
MVPLVFCLAKNLQGSSKMAGRPFLKGESLQLSPAQGIEAVSCCAAGKKDTSG